MKNHKEVSVRIWVSFSVLALVALAIVVKTFIIQFDSSLDEASNNMPVLAAQLRKIDPTRGNILSSEGRLLAASVPMYEVRWDSQCPKNIDLVESKLDSLCEGLAAIFDESAETYRTRFDEAWTAKNKYALIQEGITFNQLERYNALPLANLNKYTSGLISIKSSVRQKPFGLLASRTIGAHRDNNPVGIEEAYNEVLAGVAGQQWKERIAGNVWKPLTDEYEVEPVEGLDVVSTIDVGIQDAATHALEAELLSQEAAWGCMIVMEVETGYIRAMTNLQRGSDGTYNEGYNFAIAEQVEPGSTFKLPVMLAAMEAGKIAITDSIDTGNGMQDFYGHNVKDSNWDEGGHGTGTAAQIFAWSSNIGMASLVDGAYGHDKQGFLNGLHKLHIDRELGIALKGETPPFIYKEEGDGAWSGLSHVQMAYGYECRQTPLQSLAFYNAIANGGRLLKPQFVQAYQRNNEVVEAMEPVVLAEHICSEQTVANAQRMLEMVCEPEGTAYYAFKGTPYKVAGKTGTAKMNNPRGGYYEHRYRASFCGYFPADNPTYSAIVVIEDPRSGSYYGSSVSAPIFREVADRIYTTREELMITSTPTEEVAAKLPVSLDGHRSSLEAAYAAMSMPAQVNTDATWVNTSTREEAVELTARSTSADRVPNVQGMGLKDALYLLENRGLNVEIKGHGMVKRQSLPPGTHIRDDQRITIELG